MCVQRKRWSIYRCWNCKGGITRCRRPFGKRPKGLLGFIGICCWCDTAVQYSTVGDGILTRSPQVIDGGHYYSRDLSSSDFVGKRTTERTQTNTPKNHDRMTYK